MRSAPTSSSAAASSPPTGRRRRRPWRSPHRHVGDVLFRGVLRLPGAALGIQKGLDLRQVLRRGPEMYSLPAYNNVDPNPLMAPFFILFYGIMMADMGYGRCR